MDEYEEDFNGCDEWEEKEVSEEDVFEEFKILGLKSVNLDEAIKNVSNWHLPNLKGTTEEVYENIDDEELLKNVNNCEADESYRGPIKRDYGYTDEQIEAYRASKADDIVTEITKDDPDDLSYEDIVKTWNEFLNKNRSRIDKKKNDQFKADVNKVVENRPLVQKVEPQEVLLTMTVDKILCFYVNVGSLPSDRVESLINKLKNEYKNIETRLPQNVNFMYIPVRNGDTRIEFLNLGA